MKLVIFLLDYPVFIDVKNREVVEAALHPRPCDGHIERL